MKFVEVINLKLKKLAGIEKRETRSGSRDVMELANSSNLSNPKLSELIINSSLTINR